MTKLPLQKDATAMAVFQPFFDLLKGGFMTPAQLGERWQYSPDHLSNCRRTGKGVPWLKLPTGAVRYRTADVVAAEIAGTAGPLTVERVLLAVSACPSVSEADRAKMIEHLRVAMQPGRTWLTPRP